MRNASRNGRPEPVELEALHQGGRIAKERRIELGLTLEDLAKETGLSTSFLSRLENGKLASVTVVDLMRVAKALDTPVVSFFLDELSERIFVTRADQRRRVVRLRYDLEEGDTIYYPATLPHRWENPARKRARFLGVCTPPGY